MATRYTLVVMVDATLYRADKHGYALHISGHECTRPLMDRTTHGYTLHTTHHCLVFHSQRTPNNHQTTTNQSKLRGLCCSKFHTHVRTCSSGHSKRLRTRVFFLRLSFIVVSFTSWPYWPLFSFLSKHRQQHRSSSCVHSTGDLQWGNICIHRLMMTGSPGRNVTTGMPILTTTAMQTTTTTASVPTTTASNIGKLCRQLHNHVSFKV